MESSSSVSVSDESSEANGGGCCSSSTTPSMDAVNLSRTYSDVSSFSEEQGGSSSSADHSGPFEPSAAVSRLIGRRSPGASAASALSRLSMKPRADVLDRRSTDDELELVKERFSKLLLGEDMSGSGKGVCTAVAISNAITNLYATVFGSCHKLEPLPAGKKTMWRREMDCLLSVCDYIVEFYPSSQTLPDGTKVEVMATRPRSDIYINLPALEKLDAMLIVSCQQICHKNMLNMMNFGIRVRQKDELDSNFCVCVFCAGDTGQFSEGGVLVRGRRDEVVRVGDLVVDDVVVVVPAVDAPERGQVVAAGAVRPRRRHLRQGPQGPAAEARLRQPDPQGRRRHQHRRPRRYGGPRLLHGRPPQEWEGERGGRGVQGDAGGGEVLAGLPAGLPGHVVGARGAGDGGQGGGGNVRVAAQGERQPREVAVERRQGARRRRRGPGQERDAGRPGREPPALPQAQVPRLVPDHPGYKQDPVQQGYWPGNPGELLKGAGELGFQHSIMD